MRECASSCRPTPVCSWIFGPRASSRRSATHPTLSVHPRAASVEVGDGGDGKVSLQFRVRDIEPPRDLSESDRQKMLDNLRSPEVLDAARFPTIELRGRYEGTVDGGDLRGELVVAGAAAAHLPARRDHAAVGRPGRHGHVGGLARRAGHQAVPRAPRGPQAEGLDTPAVRGASQRARSSGRRLT